MLFASTQSTNDYYPFGSQLPGRKFDGTSYKFGFNGKENDDEVYGDGNFQDYGMRYYDTRICRFVSVDPITAKYPMLTPYQFASDNPIKNIDLDGLEGVANEINHMPGLDVFKKNTYFYSPDLNTTRRSTMINSNRLAPIEGNFAITISNSYGDPEKANPTMPNPIMDVAERTVEKSYSKVIINGTAYLRTQTTETVTNAILSAVPNSDADNSVPSMLTESYFIPTVESITTTSTTTDFYQAITFENGNEVLLSRTQCFFLNPTTTTASKSMEGVSSGLKNAIASALRINAGEYKKAGKGFIDLLTGNAAEKAVKEIKK